MTDKLKKLLQETATEQNKKDAATEADAEQRARDIKQRNLAVDKLVREHIEPLFDMMQENLRTAKLDHKIEQRPDEPVRIQNGHHIMNVIGIRFKGRDLGNKDREAHIFWGYFYGDDMAVYYTCGQDPFNYKTIYHNYTERTVAELTISCDAVKDEITEAYEKIKSDLRL